MKFKQLIAACDEVNNPDLIRLDTFAFLDSHGNVLVDNYHKLTAESHVDIVYNAVNAPFAFSHAIQEAAVTKNFEWFNRLVKDAWFTYDTHYLPNYALIKYKDYFIGKLYGVTHYKELFDCIDRFVF